MNPFFTDPAQASLDRAAAAAGQREQRTVEPRHILLGLLDVSSGPLPAVLGQLEVGRDALREAVTRSLPRTRRDEPPSSPPELPYTRRAEAVLEAARDQARGNDRTRVGATDLFVALATEKGITRTLLEEFGLDDARVRRAVDAVTGQGEGTGDASAGEEPAAKEPPGEEAAADEPDAGKPATGMAATREPEGGEPATREPPAGEPATREHATREPPAGEPGAEEPPAGEQPAGEQPTGEPPTGLAGTGDAAAEEAGGGETSGEEADVEDAGAAPEPETEGPPPPDSTPAFRSGFDASASPEADVEDGAAHEADEEADEGGERSGPLAAFRDTLGSILSAGRRRERPGPATDEDGAASEGEAVREGKAAREGHDAPRRPTVEAPPEPEVEPPGEEEIERKAPDRELEWEPRPSAPPKEPVTEAGPGPVEVDPVDLLRVDDSSSTAIYEQIIRGLEEAVATGKLETGDRLPSIRALADALSVSPGTTARAYRELERRDVVVTRGRRGTYIAPRDEGAPSREERIRALADELRPAVVEAYHMGAATEELEAALREAMKGILE